MTWFVGKVNAAKPFLPVIEEGLKYQKRIVVINKKCGAGFETVDPLIDSKIERAYIESKNFDPIEPGLYLSVNSFHQFNKEEAKEILSRAAKKRYPIVVVEGNNDSLWQVFGMTVIVPLTVILTAPFVKPFRPERLVFTYLIPILPLVTFLDGFLALFKLYAPADLNELTSSIITEKYEWRSGKSDNGRGGKIIYLIGHPTE
ncbi:MAG: hypothetical protein JNJ99_17350 [Crocinitomicaceae bacterium]|nr:hypothetical protein [Crocinitomicaceae bacterium]